MAIKNFPVIVRQGESGKYIAECPSLSGCLTQGDTVEEALANAREAILLCIEDLTEHGEPIPEPVTPVLSEVSVEV